MRSTNAIELPLSLRQRPAANPAISGIIVDATIVSQLWLNRSNPKTHGWITGNLQRLLVPTKVLDVIDHGIEAIREREPVHAEELQQWRRSLARSGMRFIRECDEVRATLATIREVTHLRNLWCPDSGGRKAKHAQDIHVAAYSLVHGLPIATLKRRDFARIDAFFSLPGVFNPATSHWAIPPRGAVLFTKPYGGSHSRHRTG